MVKLTSLKSLRDTATGENLFLNVCETRKEFQLPWKKTKEMTNDEAEIMIGKKTGGLMR
jgi:hypothetical protein